MRNNIICTCLAQHLVDPSVVAIKVGSCGYPTGQLQQQPAEHFTNVSTKDGPRGTESHRTPFRLLLPAHGHGQGIPRVRLPPQQDRAADDLRVLVAGLPDLQRNDGETEEGAELHYRGTGTFIAVNVLRSGTYRK